MVNYGGNMSHFYFFITILFIGIIAQAEDSVLIVNPDDIVIKREKRPTGNSVWMYDVTSYYVNNRLVAEFNSSAQSETHAKLLRIFEQEKILAQRNREKMQINLTKLRELELKKPPFSYETVLLSSIEAISRSKGGARNELAECRYQLSQLQQVREGLDRRAISSERFVKSVKAILDVVPEGERAPATIAK